MTKRSTAFSRTRQVPPPRPEKELRGSDRPQSPSPAPSVTPAFADLPWDKIWANVALGSFALALLLLPVALAVRGKDIASVRAERALAREDWAAAARFLQKSLGKVPERAADNVTLARCFVRSGKVDKAREQVDAAFLKAGELEKDQGQMAMLHALRAWTRFERGEKEEAVKDAREALKRNENQAIANAVLVRYYVDKQQPADGKKYFDKIVNLPQYAPLVAAFRKQVAQLALAIPESDLQDVPEKAPPPPIKTGS